MSPVTLQRARARLFPLCVPAALLAGACSSDSQSPPADDAATLSIQPASIAFEDTVGRPGPSPRPVTIANGGAGALAGITVGAITYGTGGAGWLTATLSGTDAPATLTLAARDSGLAPGNYTATVPVTAASASNSPQNVTVTYRLAPRPGPAPIAGTVIVATGNMGGCGGALQKASADVVTAANPDYLFVLGDLVKPGAGRTVATLEDYQRCYHPVWGRFKPITWVALGDSEVDQDIDSPTAGMALGADAYFGPERVGPPGKNYFSFDIGAWHIVVLNVQGGGPKVLPANIRYNSGSAQLRWLSSDLSAHRNKCTIAFWHEPMWMSSSDPPTPTDPWPNHAYRQQSIRGIWTVLYQRGADVVVNGSKHIYERFAPMRYAEGYQNPTPSEFAADSARGIRQFTSGLAGNGPLATPAYDVVHPLSEYLSGGNGVLKITLGDGIYTWEFLNTKHSKVQDWGHGTCH